MMKIYTQEDSINKTLTIIDSCQVDALINFDFLVSDLFEFDNPNNKRWPLLKKYFTNDFNIILSQENKKELITSFAELVTEGEICHYWFYYNNLKIGEGFDHCEINILNPKFFNFTQEHFDNLFDVEVYFREPVQ